MEENTSREIQKRTKKNNLTLPRPVSVDKSPLSSPYFQKLAQLSPRPMRMLDPNFSPSKNYLEKADAKEAFDQKFLGSTGSSTSSGGTDCNGTMKNEENIFNFQPIPMEIADKDESDIEFFLQVVSVFNEYLDDKIMSLEQQYVNHQKLQLSLQKKKKKLEDQALYEENQLSRDVASLVSTLHQRQMELKLILQKKNREVLNKNREEEDRCRRNMKKISELLSFAKQHRSVSGGSLKESLMQEFKERLKSIDNLSTETQLETNQPIRINLDSARKAVSSVKFSSNNREDESPSIAILAQQPNDQFTSTSIVVRWQCELHKPCILHWTYINKRDLIEKESDSVEGCAYTITDLPSNREITVKARYSEEHHVWSQSAKFKTLEAPSQFTFDPSTAHVKLKMSPDKNTVYFSGNESASPKSPSRFSFALNVLGTRPFYAGKHYWEVAVNGNGWACGVAYQGVPRNSWLGSNQESWILHHNPRRFEYKVRHGGEAHEIDPKLSSPRDYLKKVGIFLVMEEGIISFVDPSKQRILYTYFEDRFTEPVCAAVNPFYHGESLTLQTGLNVPKYLLSSIHITN